jgi:hypothetical protein
MLRVVLRLTLLLLSLGVVKSDKDDSYYVLGSLSLAMRYSESIKSVLL